MHISGATALPYHSSSAGAQPRFIQRYNIAGSDPIALKALSGHCLGAAPSWHHSPPLIAGSGSAIEVKIAHKSFLSLPLTSTIMAYCR
jgi:hypothetical protein